MAIPPWRCSVLYQGKNDRQKADGGVDIVESPGEAGVILQALELGLGEGVVIADLVAAQRASHPEVGEQLRDAFAGHGRLAVGVQGEDLRLDALLEAGLPDQHCGEGGVLPLGEPSSGPRSGGRCRARRRGRSSSSVSVSAVECRGRAAAPWPAFTDWVSATLPPNRTCDFHRIRLST